MRGWLRTLKPLAVALSAMLIAAPRFALALDESSCRLRVRGAPAVLARCSTLEVRENPDDPASSTLPLFVARVPALASVPQPDPLVLIAGGPGQSSVDLYLQLRNAFGGVLAQRDIVLMDQRGTGRSATGYECPTPEDLDIQTAAADLLETLVERCRANVEHDPRFFTTSIAVRDLDTLRAALGIEQWNLYGVSYGTRVAQHYLRRYPEHTRAVVLDGVVPPDLALGPEIAEVAQQALDTIFARCREDAGCRDRFGDLAAKFADVRAALANGGVTVSRTDPETGETEDVPVLEAHLQGLIRLMSYSTATVALLPLVIDDAHAHHYDTLLSQTEMVLGGVDQQSLSFPMHNSVVCAEDLPRVDRDNTRYDEGTYLGATIMDALVAICDNWPAGVVDDDFFLPVASDRPVLILSGGNDPVTPPRYGARVAAEGLRNSLHVIAPEQGHGTVAVGCAPRLIADFVEAAAFTELDADCLDEAVPLPFFLSPAGPAP
jgi:pimeloyl-ACP methyl ester carboxylesterase